MYAFIVSYSQLLLLLLLFLPRSLPSPPQLLRTFLHIIPQCILYTVHIYLYKHSYILIAFLHMGIFHFGLFFGYSLYLNVSCSFLYVCIDAALLNIRTYILVLLCYIILVHTITNLHVNKTKLYDMCLYICRFIYFYFWAYSCSSCSQYHVYKTIELFGNNESQNKNWSETKYDAFTI